jgi:hypothetical protein
VTWLKSSIKSAVKERLEKMLRLAQGFPLHRPQPLVPCDPLFVFPNRKLV